MSGGVSQSRFYMWRAIFAIAHVDGQIDKKEEGFMDTYLKTVPFSLQQKAILEDDIIHPRDPGEMLAQVSDPADQGMFFQFARMMVWSDGNYAVQEKEIMERLLGTHMEQLDMTALTGALEGSREKAAEMKAAGGGGKGVGTLISRWFDVDRGRRRSGREVSESRFYMWRAIFAMAHADHQITENESRFMLDVLDKENFSREQREILEGDIDTAQNAMEMFMRIAEQEDRSLFFYYARMLCWSDGNFDEQEQEIMLRLKSIHVRNIDFEKLVNSVHMELDEGYKTTITEDMEAGDHPLKALMRRFRIA